MNTENTEENFIDGKNTEPSAGGRPPLYRDPDVLEMKVEQYFDKVSAEGDDALPTMAGLCRFLGFSTRDALRWYDKRSPQFSRIVKSARLRLEEDREKRLHTGKHASSAMFDLAANYGWKNPQHVKHSGDPDGQPIESRQTLDMTKLSPQELAALASIRLPADRE